MNIEDVREYCLAKPIPGHVVRGLIDRAYDVVFTKLPKKTQIALNAK